MDDWDGCAWDIYLSILQIHGVDFLTAELPQHPMNQGYIGCSNKHGTQYCKECTAWDLLMKLPEECASVRRFLGASLIVPRKEAVIIHNLVEETTVINGKGDIQQAALVAELQDAPDFTEVIIADDEGVLA